MYICQPEKKDMSSAQSTQIELTLRKSCCRHLQLHLLKKPPRLVCIACGETVCTSKVIARVLVLTRMFRKFNSILGNTQSFVIREDALMLSSVTNTQVYLPAWLPGCLPGCLAAWLPICLASYLPAYLPACLPACLPGRLPACLPAYLPACLPA
jgi:hypothetical protein